MAQQPNSPEAQVSDFAAALDAGSAIGAPKQVEEDKEILPYAVVPAGYAVRTLDRLERPTHKCGNPQLNDAASFAAYFLRHNQDSQIYASLAPAQFVAVLNDHTSENPDWRDHKATYQLKHSREWTAWTGHDGASKAFAGNVEFAEWLEDQALDVVDPTGAEMLQIALSFKATENARYSNAARLQDGTINLEYQRVVDGSATMSGGGKAQIPERFAIEIPVFDGPSEPRHRIEARFRYRLTGGALRIWYQLERPHAVVDAAFRDIWNRIETGTKTKILYGTP